jgi:aspartate/methionine/tyrosine aminotransferase
VIPIVGQWTRAHPGTISLGQGIVHYAPPPEVSAAVVNATTNDPGVNRYADVAGGDELIQLISTKLACDNGIDVAGQNATIVCTAGANMGFLNAVLAIADVDDEIILLAPYYFNHHMAVEIAGCRPVVVPCRDDHQPDLDALRRALSPRTRAIVSISPNNPTGAVYPKATLVAINALCRRHDVYHIHDEAYEYFVYDDAEHFSPGSIAGAGGHTISLYSLSKSFGMAGWRCGYSVVPAQLLQSIKKIQDTNLICPPIICQAAAAAALRVGSPWCRQAAAGLRDVRDAAMEILDSLGEVCEFRRPRGGFYLFLKLASSRSDMDIVESLIRDHGVAVLPGSAFGETAGCSIRISYGALDADTVLEGVQRLGRGLTQVL